MSDTVRNDSIHIAHTSKNNNESPMPRFLNSLLALMLYTISGAVSAQTYDNFNFVGEITASGIVASIEFSTDDSALSATLSYADQAGASKVYNVRFSPSDVIREGVTVYMPEANFGSWVDLVNEPSLGLDNVQFLTGRLVNQELADDTTPPPHWFRMTLHEGQWSGMFRVSNRVYTIDRLQEITQVRSIQSTDLSFEPAKQVKLGALVDDNYIISADSVSTKSYGHILALESIHVLDGLLADSLGVTLKLDSVIYKSTAEITGDSGSLSAGVPLWLASNSTANGLTDTLATLVFSGATTQATTTTSYTENNFVLQGNTQHYQLETAHYFGKLLGIPFEEATVQDMKSDQSVPFLAAHWSDQQRAFLRDNPPPAELVRLLSYDAPPIEITETVTPTPIPDWLLDGEEPESNGGPILLSDGSEETVETDTDLATGGNGGGGMFSMHFLLMFFVCVFRKRVVI